MSSICLVANHALVWAVLGSVSCHWPKGESPRNFAFQPLPLDRRVLMTPFSDMAAPPSSALPLPGGKLEIANLDLERCAAALAKIQDYLRDCQAFHVRREIGRQGRERYGDRRGFGIGVVQVILRAEPSAFQATLPPRFRR